MLLQRIATPVLALLLLVTPAWGSEKPERIYIFALKAYQDGLYEVSADAFREYLASPGPGKQQAEAGLFLGQALLALGRDEEGLAALEVAAKTDSKASVAPLARMIRAQRYLDLVRYGEAQKMERVLFHHDSFRLQRVGQARNRCLVEVSPRTFRPGPEDG
ncbi:MAG: hypothetical protein IH788_02965 [Nitrospinae bacterium]|nr:hypothetical protein [Nitrospinota bacterium]